MPLRDIECVCKLMQQHMADDTIRKESPIRGTDPDEDAFLGYCVRTPARGVHVDMGRAFARLGAQISAQGRIDALQGGVILRHGLQVGVPALLWQHECGSFAFLPAPKDALCLTVPNRCHGRDQLVE